MDTTYLVQPRQQVVSGELIHYLNDFLFFSKDDPSLDLEKENVIVFREAGQVCLCWVCARVWCVYGLCKYVSVCKG